MLNHCLFTKLPSINKFRKGLLGNNIRIHLLFKYLTIFEILLSFTDITASTFKTYIYKLPSNPLRTYLDKQNFKYSQYQIMLKTELSFFIQQIYEDFKEYSDSSKYREFPLTDNTSTVSHINENTFYNTSLYIPL